MHIRLLLRSIRAPWGEGTLHVVARLLCSLLNGCRASQNDQVSKRNLLPVRLGAVEILLDRLQRLKNLRQLRRLVDFPILLRRQTNARPVRSTALVAAAVGRRRRPG